MSKYMGNWLDAELQHGLRQAPAPAELWDRIQAARNAPPRPRRAHRSLVWATAAAVLVATVGLALLQLRRQSSASEEAFATQILNAGFGRVAFQCQNPAKLRAWVRANAGIDLPLRPGASPSIQLVGAQMVEDARGVEVAYRAGNRDAVLLVTRADGAANGPHDRSVGSVSSWVMDGQRYTLACNDPADLQLACKLCHLD